MRRLVFTGLSLIFLTTAFAATVPDDATKVHPLLPGMQAPSFTAIAADGSRFEFNPKQRSKPAVIIFYRGGWCPFCQTYLSELRKVDDTIIDMGRDLIFLSADSPESLAPAVADGQKLRYALLSDNSMKIAEQFGIAFHLDDATFQRYKVYGLDIEKASGYKHHILPAPATFIVDTDGIIKFSYVNPDYTVRLHPDVLVAAARSMPDYDLKKIRAQRRMHKSQ